MGEEGGEESRGCSKGLSEERRGVGAGQLGLLVGYNKGYFDLLGIGIDNLRRELLPAVLASSPGWIRRLLERCSGLLKLIVALNLYVPDPRGSIMLSRL
jgi:hypothetical protein